MVVTAGLAGCYGTIKPARAPQAAVVFTEVEEGSSPADRAAESLVDLTIRASVKTPTAEHYLLESRPQPPLAEGFPFELEVDGQEIVWKVKGVLEKTPVSGPEGRLPEGGEGMRYGLDKTISLDPGPHHVVFGVPHDDYYTEVKITLTEDEPHVLEFQPVYAMGRRGYQTFFRGISRTAVFLDGVRIK